MKTRKAKIGGRHIAWMRGAFNGQRLVVPGADKPEAKAGAVDATRANVAQHRPAPFEEAHKSAAA